MNEFRPLAISVIVPYLNQPEYLGNCLQALGRQNFDLKQVEIIVVDNGSKELPSEICERFANVRLAWEETPGPGPARNKGISISRAPILAFIDADCIAAENWLQAVARAFDDPQTQVIGGDVRIALIDPDRITMLEAYECIYAYRQQMYIDRLGFSGTGNLAMRRSVFEKVGPFAGIGVAEDREWGQRATGIGFSICYCPGMKVFHPARRSFSELQAKWDRHVAHDYTEQVHGPKDGLVWFGKAVALALSPFWEIPRIVISDRVGTPGTRLKALGVLTAIRLYRTLRMLETPFRGRRAIKKNAWNRGW
jgi:glycosyltransferase involved in cell wall biosynthesis